MKDVVSKNLKENERKVFTKKGGNSKINKNYNPFEVDYKIYKRRDGLYMKNIVLEEIREELDWKGKIVSYIFPKTFTKLYKLGITFGFNNK